MEYAEILVNHIMEPFVKKVTSSIDKEKLLKSFFESINHEIADFFHILANRFESSVSEEPDVEVCEPQTKRQRTLQSQSSLSSSEYSPSPSPSSCSSSSHLPPYESSSALEVKEDVVGKKVKSIQDIKKVCRCCSGIFYLRGMASHEKTCFERNGLTYVPRHSSHSVSVNDKKVEGKEEVKIDGDKEENIVPAQINTTPVLENRAGTDEVFPCVRIPVHLLASCIGLNRYDTQIKTLCSFWEQMDPRGYANCIGNIQNLFEFASKVPPLDNFLLDGCKDGIEEGVIDHIEKICDRLMSEAGANFVKDPYLTNRRSLGRRYERDALEMFKEQTNKTIHSTQIYFFDGMDLSRSAYDDGHPNSWRIRGECDGIVDDGIIEVKTRQPSTPLRDEPDVHERVQIQTYLHMTERDLCYFVQYRHSPLECKVTKVKRNEGWWSSHIRPRISNFVTSVHRLLSKDPKHSKYKMYILYSRHRETLQLGRK